MINPADAAQDDFLDPEILERIAREEEELAKKGDFRFGGRAPQQQAAPVPTTTIQEPSSLLDREPSDKREEIKEMPSNNKSSQKQESIREQRLRALSKK